MIACQISCTRIRGRISKLIAQIRQCYVSEKQNNFDKPTSKLFTFYLSVYSSSFIRTSKNYLNLSFRGYQFFNSNNTQLEWSEYRNTFALAFCTIVLTALQNCTVVLHNALKKFQKLCKKCVFVGFISSGHVMRLPTMDKDGCGWGSFAILSTC